MSSAIRRFFEPSTPGSIDKGLLVLRVGFGLTLAFGHGINKLFSLGKFIRNVERHGFPLPEVMGPIGAQGPVSASGDQVLGSVPIVDDDHRALLEAVENTREPDPGFDLNLHPATVGYLPGMGLEPDGDLRSDPGVDKDQAALVVGSHPAFPPPAIDPLRQSHWEVVHQLVCDDHSPNPIRDGDADGSFREQT